MVTDSIRQTAELYGSRTAFHSRYGEITYGQLWKMSGRLAFFLQDKLKDDRSPVVVYGHKDPLMLVCFLACVRSGRAYCPVDTSVPEDRVLDIIRETGCGVVLAAAEMPGEPDTEVLAHDQILDRIAQIPEDTDLSGLPGLKPDEVFYIIFTSGSTGKPKGVQITAGNLESYLSWSVGLGGEMPAGAQRVYLNQAPFSFDLSVMDLYTALACGAEIWSVDKALQQDVPALLRYLPEGGITHWVSTPSFAAMCLGDPSFGEALLPALHAFLFCGETLTVTTARNLAKRFPHAVILNTYGPTETTVCVTSTAITQEMIEAGTSLPIGRVKPGTEIRILRQDGTEAPEGETGELIIVGDTVSPGYFHNPEKTEAAFFQTEKDGRPVRAYRTGDAGHYGPEGMLFYEGRIDQQIKLHGYRIELGDIESNLMKLRGISAACVVPVRSADTIRHLAAFCVRSGEIDVPDSYEGRKMVREGLRELLPAYMVPKKIVFCEELPMTANGKTDRKKLEAML